MLAGNPGRLRRTGAAFANQAGVFKAMFTPVGLGVTAAVAALGAYVAEAYKAETQTSDLNKAILATGGAAGVTVGQLSAMAVALSDGKRSGADIHDALIAVASSGKFAGEQIQTVAKAALDMADVTGQSVQ